MRVGDYGFTAHPDCVEHVQIVALDADHLNFHRERFHDPIVVEGNDGEFIVNRRDFYYDRLAAAIVSAEMLRRIDEEFLNEERGQ